MEGVGSESREHKPPWVPGTSASAMATEVTDPATLKNPIVNEASKLSDSRAATRRSDRDTKIKITAGEATRGKRATDARSHGMI